MFKQEDQKVTKPVKDTRSSAERFAGTGKMDHETMNDQMVKKLGC